MKIGTLVGAVGMALAGAAVAENVSVSSVSPSAALESAMPNPAHQGPMRTTAFRDVMDPDRLKKAREEGFGLPRAGTPAFDAAVNEVRAMIDAGQIHPWQTLISAKHLGIKTLQNEAVAFNRSDQPSLNSDFSRGANNPMGVDIDYFDGFESYITDPDPSDGDFTPEIDDQTQPSGLPGGASFFYVALDWNNPLNIPVIAAPPRDPYNGGLPPGGDVTPMLEQVLLNGQGWFGSALTGTFLGYGLTAADVFIPSVAQALVACGDFYFDDFETTVPWSPTSNLEGVIISRILMTGYFFGSPLAEPNGQIRRPQVLGPDPGLFTIGQFFAPPVNPAVGLGTKQIQLQEWFTVAMRVTPQNMFVFMRDSQTDGSAGTTIDDQRDFQFFELGWSEIYPGQAATLLAPGVFAGHGRAVNDFLALASDPSPIIAAISCDSVFTLIGGDPTPEQIMGWLPTNNYFDNFCIIGDVLPQPAQPKQIIPYKDDIELYFVGGPLILQGGTWTDNLSSRAFISTAGNTSPSPGADGGPSVQSIQQDSVIEDSRFRTEFSSATPHDQRGGITPPPADNHPVAAPGCPVCVNANILVTAATTIRAMSVTDSFILGVAEQVLLGVADDFDIIDDTIHIRLPNTLFDPTLPTAAGTRIDSPPDLADNTFNLNYPTLTNLTTDGLISTFFTLKLTLHGDGTADWSINGTVLEFDSAFLIANLLEADFQEAKTLAGQANPMSPPYTRFLSDQFSLNSVAFQSGNNAGGFFDAILVDDLCLDAKVFNPGPGPVFELPLCDDMECYVLDLPIAQQGDTPFVFAASVNDTDLDFSERLIRVVDCPPNQFVLTDSSFKLDAAGLVLDAGTLYCTYTIAAGGATLGGPGTTIALLKEKLTSCPAGSVNFSLCTAKDVTDNGLWNLVGDCVGGDTLVGTETAALFIQPAICDFLVAADWCVYTVCEVFVGTDRKGLPDPNDWCLMTNDLVYVKKPTNKTAFVCPDRVKCAGIPNNVLVDPDDMDDMTTELNPCFFNFNLNPTCPNTPLPLCADYTMQFQRNDGNELFCRYQIATISALPDPSMGGTPFTLPANLIVGAVVASDAVFAENVAEGFTPCPGTVPGPSNFELNDPKTGCPIATGTWTILDTAMDMAMNTVGVAAAFQPTDIKGYGIDSRSFPMWADPGGGGAAAGGFAGDGFIRLGSAATDDVLTGMGPDVFIDPMGLFGQVLCFENNAGAPFINNSTFNSAVSTWPDAIALADGMGPGGGFVKACVYWDLYVQDNNSTLGFRITGAGSDGTGGTIMNIRFGGPGGTIDNHAANEIAVEIDNPDMTPFPPPPPFIFGGTGIIVPLNSWFRVCVEVDSDGNWKAGMNTAGNPGGPGDVPESFDDTLMGAHPNAVLIASGTSQDQDGAGFNIADIDSWQVEQAFNEEGDGFASLAEITILALASDAASPTPASPNNFCFYRIGSVDLGGTGPMIRPVDPVTGAVDVMGDRVITGPDAIAVKFEAGISDGAMGTRDVLSFEDCPFNGDFLFCDNSPINVGTSMGSWTLVGFPDAEEANPPPVGGISNADGVTDGFAYNFPNTPADAILLACFKIIPPLPAEEIASKWYVDNIKVKEIETIIIPCPWDLNGDGQVGAADLAFLGGSWGDPGCAGMLPCPADFNGDGAVGSSDQAQLLGAWGPCP